MRDVCRIEQLLSEHGMDAPAIQAVMDELNILPKLRVASSNVRIIDSTAVALVVLKGRLKGKKVQRTVYSGMNIFMQFMQRWSVPTGLITEIRSLVQEDVEELERKVREEASRLTSDKETVERVKNKFRIRSNKATQIKRANLIATMAGLLNEGWTREALVSCLDEATCKNILES